MFRQFKDFFTFTQKDLRGLFVLISFLSIMLLLRIVLPLIFVNPYPDFSQFDRMVLAFEQSQRLALIEEKKKTTEATPQFIRPDREIAAIRLNPFPFDPNNMSEETWLNLGLSMRQVRNIQNFIAGGGRFRTKEDFRRIYTISDEEYEVLAPFIKIAEAVHGSKREPKDPVETASEAATPAIKAAPVLISINNADSTELLRVRGIGPAFARRIIRYRDLLGGFHSASQLLEVYGLDSTRFEMIAGSFTYDHSLLRLIDVNNAEIKDMTAHPYIDFYLAKSIVDERVKKGVLVSDADLYGIPLMHDAIHQKIIPYFKFSKNE